MVASPAATTVVPVQLEHRSCIFPSYKTMLSRLRASTLKNTGSTARDHLASERTFLAWLRTGLGFVALGIAVERFSQLDLTTLLPPASSATSTTNANKQVQKDDKDRQTQELVVGLMATGSGSIVYGAGRYFNNLRCLEKGLYKPSFYGVGGLSAAVLRLTSVVGWGLINDARGKEEE